MTLKNFSSAVPVIATSDVLGTVRYFEQTLGFQKQWIWGDPPVYAGVHAGGALLYVTHDPELASTIRERRLAPDIFLGLATSTASTRTIAPLAPTSPKS